MKKTKKEFRKEIISKCQFNSKKIKLLPDTEIRKDITQQIVRSNFTSDFSKMIQRLTNVNG